MILVTGATGDHNITGFSRISFTEPKIPASGRCE
jgi:hypothetical protein